MTLKPISQRVCARHTACSSWCKSGGCSHCCWPQPDRAGTWSTSQCCSSWKAAMEGRRPSCVCHAPVSSAAASPQCQGCQCCQQARLETSSVHACSWACLAFLGTPVLNTVGVHDWAERQGRNCRTSIGDSVHLLTQWQGAASWRLAGPWGRCRAAPLLSRRSWSPHHPPPPPVQRAQAETSIDCWALR